jgi:hypothetical protein
MIFNIIKKTLGLMILLSCLVSFIEMIDILHASWYERFDWKEFLITFCYMYTGLAAFYLLTKRNNKMCKKA